MVYSPASIQTSIDATIATEIDGMKAFQTAASNELSKPLITAIETILASKGRIIVTGLGKSGHVGRKIAATMASTGTPAYFVHPSEASHGDLGMILEEDVILALSWSGETLEFAGLLEYATRFHIKLIAITSNPESALAKAASVALILPKATEACPNGLAPTTSTLLQMALGDVLAVALLEARGFTAKDFKVFHPGGRLGAALKTVKDMMRSGDEMPLVHANALMSDALLTMTQKGLGCVIVTDATRKLLGLVTDGDMRRHMSADLLSKQVVDIMTKTPRTIAPSTFVSDALATMNSAKIMTLVVIENDTIIGALHLHDLLRAGVK